MNLFEPFVQRGLTLKNRIVVAPMCMYSAQDGVPNTWHAVHLGSRAVGGAGLILTEATAVEAEGRITPVCTGIYSQAQVEAWKPITEFARAQGAAIGIQLGHAGRKASHRNPFQGPYGMLPTSEGGWQTVSSTDRAFSGDGPVPVRLPEDDIHRMVETWVKAAQRSVEAGFQLIEIHGAHGYLAHQFLSPLCNDRTDGYGGDLAARSRFLLELVQAVRAEIPAEMPLWVRLSCTDWVEGGWDLEQSVQLSVLLKNAGVDLIDCSSGGIVPDVSIPVAPGYQVPFAAEIRARAGLATGAVGLITQPQQANEILERGDAEVILIARESLRDPYWPRRAARELGVELTAPVQYARGW